MRAAIPWRYIINICKYVFILYRINVFLYTSYANYGQRHFAIQSTITKKTYLEAIVDILERILKERKKRNWSEYQLAQNSGITQSTISTWYRKHMQPSISSLEKICSGFGITLSEFFSDSEAVELSSEQIEILKRWDSLDKSQKAVVLDLLDVMLR